MVQDKKNSTSIQQWLPINEGMFLDSIEGSVKGYKKSSYMVTTPSHDAHPSISWSNI
jgi:hypothetical protein